MVPISAQVGGFPPPQARASCIASHSCHACSPHHGGPAGATILCINIDPAWEWGAPVAYRGPTVLLTRACLTPQTPEMFVEGREPPWAPRRASTFTLGKITVLFFSSMKRSLMASGGERSLGIKTSQECEAHRCACHRLGRHAARRRTLLASRCGGLPVASMPGFGSGRASRETSRHGCPRRASCKRESESEEPFGLRPGRGCWIDVKGHRSFWNPLPGCGQGLTDITLHLICKCFSGFCLLGLAITKNCRPGCLNNRNVLISS